MMGNLINLSRRAFFSQITAGAVLLLGGHASGEPRPALTVWKDPNCGCCGGWVEHLRRNGFTATVIETSDVQSIKAQ